MAGTIRPNEINVSTTPILANKTLPSLSLPPTQKPTVPRAPRIDVEPLYTSIKSAISDADWTTYKTSLSSFLLGNLNQEELTQRLDRILVTRELENAHNKLILGIYGNLWRDAPEAGVASWVSSGDKVGGGTAGGKAKGDEGEKRLKGEIMALSRRERKRLKAVHVGRPFDVGIYDGIGSVMQEYHEARRVKLPETGPATTAGGYQKTNWDLEIRKRYTSSLFTETHEFPTATTISHRLLPICYENGLPQGHAADCAEYMNIATETYIKEALTNFFQLVSSNGNGFVRTAEYKRKVEREERRAERGELQRVNGGELPVEAEERRKRRLLCMEDLRLALELGDSYLGQVPIISGHITNSRFLDTPGMEEIYDTPHQKNLPNGLSNGINGPNNSMNNGWNVDLGEPMVLDDDLTWQGGSVKDLEDLDGALDGVLELGDL
ncbi:hypothetical protein K458DRAFT_360495 [Lentithecium fluviatile CBS 122367]|uniref:Transcriptional co-activator n=1 Tax=Lentithecium fluviatile CBS 122367 TaxID=1168545 RepID=A0A6G1JC95_9PLEO|nr:hypothetical protein K458DRAFT_360495 [Lentithecium fluviatile CBS 122367]